MLSPCNVNTVVNPLAISPSGNVNAADRIMVGTQGSLSEIPHQANIFLCVQNNDNIDDGYAYVHVCNCMNEKYLGSELSKMIYTCNAQM